MTNQTKVFSIIDTDPATGIANVTTTVNNYIRGAILDGFSNFCIGQVVVTPANTSYARNWYTVQVDYYNPGIM